MVLPLSAARLSQESADTRIPFGNEDLDKMSGGGLFRDSTVLISSPTGGGENGEHSLYLGFEESRPQPGRNAANRGDDFDKWEADGLLKIRCRRFWRTGLSSHLKRKQICALMTAASPHMAGAGGKAGAHISTLTDAIILLRYLELGEELGRGLTIIKMRGSQHDKHVRRFTIGSDGLHVGAPVPDIAHLIGAIPG